MISACICTHNPNPDVFSRCLDSLRIQKDPGTDVELLVIDNNSSPPLSLAALNRQSFPFAVRLVREEKPGLTQARLRALVEAAGDILVFIDDDNFLAPDYLQAVASSFRIRAKAGAIEGKNLPLPEIALPVWADAEILSFLACIDRGNEPLCLRDERTPLGAGMALRRDAFSAATNVPFLLGDRVGKRLCSGGDTELCYRIRTAGWETWYEPSLTLHHFLPARRLSLEYLAALNEAFGRDRPYIEFFWYPGTWRRRGAYIYRAALDTVKSVRLRRSDASLPAGNSDVHRVLQAAFLRGRAETLLKLAVGPSIWKGVPTLMPQK